MFRPSPTVARLVFILGLLILWEAFARLASVSPILVAPPSAVLWQVARIITTTSTVPDFYIHFWVTIRELIVAYAITAVIGVCLGLAFASSKVIGDAFEPILLTLYAIP